MNVPYRARFAELGRAYYEGHLTKHEYVEELRRLTGSAFRSLADYYDPPGRTRPLPVSDEEAPRWLT